MPFVFGEEKAGFILIKLPSYFLPWSVSGGDGRIAGKAVQVKQGNVRKPIANKIDLTRFSVVRDPYARWCGRRGAARPLPIPIGCIRHE